MKTASIALLTLATMLVLTGGAGAFYNPPTGFSSETDCPIAPTGNHPIITVTNMIGDNDGYGYGADLVPDGADLPYTNNPYEGTGWLFDNRSEAELAAIDGSQATDVEDITSVTFHHKFDMSLFKSLTCATFSIDMSGVQQGLFGGYSHLYLDGVEMSDFLTLDQGAWGSSVLTYKVDLSTLCDGMLDVTIDKWSEDHIAVDFASLTVTGYGACPVPEPTTMLLVALGLAGAGVVRRRK
jgi:hypothetical protein